MPMPRAWHRAYEREVRADLKARGVCMGCRISPTRRPYVRCFGCRHLRMVRILLKSIPAKIADLEQQEAELLAEERRLKAQLHARITVRGNRRGRHARPQPAAPKPRTGYRRPSDTHPWRRDAAVAAARKATAMKDTSSPAQLRIIR